MLILAINAGSSSLKFQLFDMKNEKLITKGLAERIGLKDSLFTIKINGEKITKNVKMENHNDAVNELLKSLIENKVVKSLDEIKGVGHRIVQGGEKFNTSSLITKKFIKVVESLNDLAPLHNPANIVGVRAFQKILPNVKQVGIFDTTFHSTMPKENFLYALPYEWYEKYGVRKYGFHGTSHEYVSKEAIKFLKLKNKESKIIVCHLGNGCSLSAVKNGKSIDTSMGLTPLEGIPMGTRSGNIDPSVIEYIIKKEKLSLDEVIKIINKKSGLYGLSKGFSDARDLENQMEKGNELAILAFNVQIKRIVDYIASYYVLLEGCDAICFTAGIGENSWLHREKIVEKLKALSIFLDKDKNLKNETVISSKNSKTKLLVIPTNEEIMIARETVRIINENK